MGYLNLVDFRQKHCTNNRSSVKFLLNVTLRKECMCIFVYRRIWVHTMSYKEEVVTAYGSRKWRVYKTKGRDNLGVIELTLKVFSSSLYIHLSTPNSTSSQCQDLLSVCIGILNRAFMNFSTLVHVQAHPNSCISLVEQNVSIIERTRTGHT